jgi:hypothetical protein
MQTCYTLDFPLLDNYCTTVPSPSYRSVSQSVSQPARAVFEQPGAALQSAFRRVEVRSGQVSIRSPSGGIQPPMGPFVAHIAGAIISPVVNTSHQGYFNHEPLYVLFRGRLAGLMDYSTSRTPRLVILLVIFSSSKASSSKRILLIYPCRPEDSRHGLQAQCVGRQMLHRMSPEVWCKEYCMGHNPDHPSVAGVWTESNRVTAYEPSPVRFTMSIRLVVMSSACCFSTAGNPAG